MKYTWKIELIVFEKLSITGYLENYIPKYVKERSVEDIIISIANLSNIYIVEE